jgi:uncharacterized protein with von Willebrand factor type A (vWA) domain
MDGIRVAAILARFARHLRSQGIDVGIGDEVDAARALSLVDLLDRGEVHRTLRTALKIRRRHWDAFDAAFDEFWSARSSRRPETSLPVRPMPGHGTALQRRGGVGSEQTSVESSDGDARDHLPGYSPQLLLRRKPFDACSPDELAALERMLAGLVAKLATRRSRRLVPTNGRGAADLRRSFRGSIATGGELVRLARRERAIDEPDILVLCDTSGSMDPHARFVLAFALSLKRVARRTEVFAFNTSLTRLTPLLAAGDVGATLDKLAASVPDWSGGTRIGESLSEFVARYATQHLSRKTVVLIVSDGLDRGDVGLVRDAMDAIHTRARRVIWLNPLSGDPRYEPTARAMQAALPFVDRLAPAHDFESLERVLPDLAA